MFSVIRLGPSSLKSSSSLSRLGWTSSSVWPRLSLALGQSKERLLRPRNDESARNRQGLIVACGMREMTGIDVGVSIWSLSLFVFHRTRSRQWSRNRFTSRTGFQIGRFRGQTPCVGSLKMSSPCGCSEVCPEPSDGCWADEQIRDGCIGFTTAKALISDACSSWPLSFFSFGSETICPVGLIFRRVPLSLKSAWGLDREVRACGIVCLVRASLSCPTSPLLGTRNPLLTPVFGYRGPIFPVGPCAGEEHRTVWGKVIAMRPSQRARRCLSRFCAIL